MLSPPPPPAMCCAPVLTQLSSLLGLWERTAPLASSLALRHS